MQIARNTIDRLLTLLLLLLISGGAALFADAPIEIILRENTRSGQMLSHVLKVTNQSDQSFNGIMAIDAPTGVRALSRDQRAVSLAPGDSSFFSFRLVLTRDLGAGEKKICYNLLTDENELVSSCETLLQIELREQLTLLAENGPSLLTNPDDSVRVNVILQNSGNVTEQVILVFNVPNLHNAPPFTEVTATLAPGEQQKFTHSFIASSNLLAAGRFQVRVTAMKGKEKKIVDTRTINVHSVITQRSYNAFFRDQLYFTGDKAFDNGMQLSYRTYNRISNTVQLQGGSYIDLPAGYLHLKGNIYKYNTHSLPYITNTSLAYQLYENQFIIGNVQEQTELSLYGRGIKALFSDKEGRRQITFGAIDQNYNLIDDQPWFKDYYSFFLKADLGGGTERSGTGGTYVYQRNPYERANFHMMGLRWKHRFSAEWSMEWKVHATAGEYWELQGNRYSGAGEMSYNGRLFKNVLLGGSAYYSDPYFPGNRKGIFSVVQHGTMQLTDNMNLNVSYNFNRSEPKSYSYEYNYRSQNQYGGISLTLPAFQNIHSSLSYQHQKESSPSYSHFAGMEYGDENLNMTSRRMGWQWRWQHPGWKYSFFGSMEGGFFQDPLEKEYVAQGKASLNFSYRWITAGVTWQQGAYYLFEQVMAQRQGKDFSRLTISASANQNFSNRLTLSSGINFTSDVYQGKIPSANLNARYNPGSNLSFILTGNWYKYPFLGDREIVNLEVGARYRFPGGVPLKGRKSTLIAKVYYDHNANRRYDEGDAPAQNYLVDIDRKAFVTGEKGEVRYTSVPFGTYAVRPMQPGEWSFDQKEISVHRFRTTVEIPLRQSGTLQGSIRYIMGENNVEIVPRYEGFRFTVISSDGKLEQTVVTNDHGKFITFLPAGEYSIVLNKKTLPEHTECKESVRTFAIAGGRVTQLEPFHIEVKTRKVNVRKFFARKDP